MTIRSEAEINRLLAPTVAEYADEERAAAEEEPHAATTSTVFSCASSLLSTRPSRLPLAERI
jgi:hypothetical protein